MGWEIGGRSCVPSPLISPGPCLLGGAGGRPDPPAFAIPVGLVAPHPGRCLPGAVFHHEPMLTPFGTCCSRADLSLQEIRRRRVPHPRPPSGNSAAAAVNRLPVGLNPIAHGNNLLITAPCTAFSIFWLTSPSPSLVLLGVTSRVSCLHPNHGLRACLPEGRGGWPEVGCPELGG